MGRILILAAAAALLVFSCNDGMSAGGGLPSSGRNERTDRSKRTQVDPGLYRDFTVEENSPKAVTAADLATTAYGKFIVSRAVNFCGEI
jgi:hypothetical protein